MAGVFDELAQPELAGDAAQQLARLEVDRARGRGRRAVRIPLDLVDVVPGIGGRIAVHRVVVENTNNLHLDQPPAGLPSGSEPVEARPGTQSVPASGILAIAAASTVSATMSSGSRLWTWDLPHARAIVCASRTIARK